MKKQRKASGWMCMGVFIRTNCGEPSETEDGTRNGGESRNTDSVITMVYSEVAEIP
jgi:hypothetical protein